MGLKTKLSEGPGRGAQRPPNLGLALLGRPRFKIPKFSQSDARLVGGNRETRPLKEKAKK